MVRLPHLIFLSLAVPLTMALPAHADDRDEELAQMKAAMQQMSQTIQSLQHKVDALEKQKAPPARVAAPASAAGPATKPVSSKPAAPGTAPNAAPTHPSVSDAKSILDTTPPIPHGYIAIPNTDVIFKIGGSARLDAIQDFGRNGNPNWFIPATIPVGPQKRFDDNTDHFVLHGKGSRLSVDVLRPGDDNHFHIYYENDFFGDSANSSLVYRVRHFYGEAWGVLAGHTFSNFMDIDVYPDLIDYEGPNGLVYVRQPQIRYTYPLADGHTKIAVAIENPNPLIDTDDSRLGTNSEVHHRFPDLTAHLRYDEPKWGHFQLSGVYRQLSYENELRRDETNGWGVSASLGLNLSPRDSVQLQATYGEGIARYIQDPSVYNLDAGLDSAGSLHAIPVLAVSAGYTHHWSDRWRSTLTYSYAQVDPEFSNGPDSYRRSHYAAANLIYQSSSAVSFGLEYLYGLNELLDGNSAPAHRLDFVIKYDINK